MSTTLYIDALVSSSKGDIIVTTIICLLSSFFVFSAIYRLYFSPLSNFPGPKLTALSSISAYYYDVILGGKYLWQIERMHKIYGPIVRTKPNMVHINDPEFIDQLYTGPSRRREKTEFFCNGVPLFKNAVAFCTQGHELHRRKRAPLSEFFSKKSVRRIEPMICNKITKVLAILRRYGKSRDPLDMKLLYTATNNDIITEYSFGKSWDSLDAEDLNEDFFNAFHNFPKGFHLNCYHPWIFWLMMMLPQSVLGRVMPILETVKPFLEKVEKHVQEIKTTAKNDQERLTIIRKLLDSDMPEEEKTVERLGVEGQQMLAGGTDSGSHTLTMITYYLLANVDKLAKLKKELDAVMPDENAMPDCKIVETLPYLTAVIQEVFRLHPPATFCIERIAPDEDLQYKSPHDGETYVIPRGVTVGMTLPLLGRIESLYSEPNDFQPERFIENPDLVKLQMPFGKGTRRCLGENLAMAELYMLVAAVFRKYEAWDGTGTQRGPTMELYKTSAEDVNMVSASILPFIKDQSRGVRVVVRN